MYNIQLLLIAEQSPFVLIDTYGHYDLIEHTERTGQNIQMAGRKRIKGTWK